MNQKDYDIRRRLEKVHALLNATLGGTSHTTDHGATACLDEMRQVVTDQVILQLLEMPTVYTRFDSVVTHKKGTFEWMFTEPDIVFKKEPYLATTFPDWLDSGNGVFHICGKPGAGKSTLMKFLYRHNTTRTLLNNWSGNNELLFATFFFWRIGADEQKNIGGLIRSLLYQILCKDPQLSRQIFSKQTREKMTDGFRRRAGAILESDEIMAAFSRLVQVSTSSSRDQDAPGIRICLFIDGLDEFDDTNINQSRRELVEKLQKWTTSSNGNVKICVSSRIEEPFMQMFDRSKRFTLHNLTKEDINIYIQSTLQAHPTFRKHQEKSPRECRALIFSVEQYTQGVFLWVALVLKELESCLDDGSSVELLQGIVHKIPQNWNDFLEDILSRINKHVRKGVEVFLAALLRSTGILMSHHDPDSKKYIVDGDNTGTFFKFPTSGAFLILQASDKGIPMLGDVTMDTFGIEKEVWFDPEMAYAQFMDAISDIIERRCKGLVQITHETVDPDLKYPFVQFMHRSIPEYLENYFSQRPGSGLDKDHQATVTLSWAILMDLKYRSCGLSLSSFLCSAGQVSPRNEQVSAHYIAVNLPQFLRQLRIDDTWEDVFHIFVSIDHGVLPNEFVSVIVSSAFWGLYEFIDWLLRKTDILAHEEGQIILITSVIDSCKTLRGSVNHIRRTAEVLLTHNRCLVHSCRRLKSGIEVPLWYKVLELELEQSVETRLRAPEKWVSGRFLELWLRHGANPRVGIYVLADYGIAISSLPDNSDRLDLRLNQSHKRLKIDHLQHLELEWKRAEGTGTRWVSLRDFVRCSDYPNKSKILELLEDDAEEDHEGTPETPPETGQCVHDIGEGDSVLKVNTSDAQVEAQTNQLKAKDDTKTSTSENETGDTVILVQSNEKESSWLMSLPGWELLMNCRYPIIF